MSYILTVVSKFYLKNQTKKIKKWEKKFSCIECACSPDTGAPGVYPPLAYRLITNTSIKETEAVYII